MSTLPLVRWMIVVEPDAGWAPSATCWYQVTTYRYNDGPLDVNGYMFTNTTVQRMLDQLAAEMDASARRAMS